MNNLAYWIICALWFAGGSIVGWLLRDAAAGDPSEPPMPPGAQP